LFEHAILHSKLEGKEVISFDGSPSLLVNVFGNVLDKPVLLGSATVPSVTSRVVEATKGVHL
jgi:hypothetical protein